MGSDLFRALFALREPRIKAITWQVGLICLALFAALVNGVAVLLLNLDLFQTGWLESLADWLGIGIAFILGVLLFPLVATLVASLYLERVAEVVEGTWYTGLPPPRQVPLAEAAAQGLKFAALQAGCNILALPLYLIPGAQPFIYYGLNGFLLGREFADLVGARRLSPADLVSLRRRERPALWLSGVIIAALMTVPVVNFFSPIVATAFMVHRFARLRPPAP
jgi:uncharacterized protein involved in cysteine biosynthesis